MSTTPSKIAKPNCQVRIESSRSRNRDKPNSTRHDLTRTRRSGDAWGSPLRTAAVVRINANRPRDREIAINLIPQSNEAQFDRVTDLAGRSVTLGKRDVIGAAPSSASPYLWGGIYFAKSSSPSSFRDFAVDRIEAMAPTAHPVYIRVIQRSKAVGSRHDYQSGQHAKGRRLT